VEVEESYAERADMLIEGAALTHVIVFLFLNSWRSTLITGSRCRSRLSER
jgi:multidrug efflux pump subunit AcrB